MKRRRTSLLALTALVAAALTALPAGPAQAEEVEQVKNGTFDTTTAPWWTTGNVTAGLTDGRLCADIPGGTTNRWDAAVGQNDITLVKGESYRFAFSASGTPQGNIARAIVGLSVAPYDTYFEVSPQLNVSGDSYTYTFTSPVDTTQAQVGFQVGGNANPFTFCMDDVSLLGGVPPEVYEPDTGPRVRVNQVAYLPAGPKNATLVTDAPAKLPWKLKNASGTVVAHGRTTPRGLDASSGQNVHSIDFGAYRKRGTGFTLVVDGETSRPFDIDPRAYERLRLDSLKYYYTQRSGTPISDALRPGYGRAAGHVDVAPNQGDGNVPCQPGVCDYRLDVTGGWYDAGDHGKYVVNGGISTWEVLSTYERALHARTGKAGKLGDGSLDIPESGNKVPDLLDEVRWELDFMLRMQVPKGQPLAGMAHHKIHDEQWTGLPLMPAADPQKRELHPPSTAATLNLAATAAQAARLYRPYDRAFATKALAAARTAWAAAVEHPAMYASESDGIGGGTYADNNVTDEFYWAAAQLYLTTGEKAFQDYVLASPVHTADIFGPIGFDWARTAAAGRLDLATVPSKLPGRDKVRKSVIEGADRYLAALKSQPYGMPYAPAGNVYDWGSNHQILNNAVVVATAYDIGGASKYREGALQSMDYLFGRNALNISYVTGYGEVDARNQHSRWYAHQLDPDQPNPPAGTLAGGPNSGIQDPYAQSKLQGCVGQFCYIDDIQSWSTNEHTINWNAALARMASFVADQT
ncbi:MULTISPECIES: glycoside hydrolase family 9 protein [Streptomyces]|uniref:Endoglucanase n=1 Tax=Streptomyces stelliscabiei TaxID=146820 RepID=A0A8I0TVT2_9ACTN|nr:MULTISPECIES: glycoside hydrolase family 9 protein [Streptomyces]KND42649.1 glycosyl hydrolase family 5 [Streptomyces stelliscabiei]MBE1602104.1 endoglucanase [Streptomyces stelliscabiei]MDX2514316.1 glycoside hydrolase family 9 protein [Streptomyces stelliscabiei]MDX2552419.1 glycoside hydrolase family 9 protein [Streptomyces stelliscabiei]MDX2611814.1 glycoside hydrolase family 9 protein [Streptomyces stelliscabiei]